MASTCSTSLVPMPKASAPKAPWVAVWLSPHTIVMPGLGAALLGPDHVHDALAGVAHRVVGDAELGGVACAARRPGRADTGSAIGWSMSVGRHVVVLGGDGQIGAAHAAARRGAGPSKACGLVTSWTRWRSMYSRSGSSGADAHDVAIPHLLGQGLGSAGGRGTSSTSDPLAVPVAGRRLHASQILGYCSYFMESVSNVGVLDKAIHVVRADRGVRAPDAARAAGEHRLAAGDAAPHGGGAGDARSAASRVVRAVLPRPRPGGARRRRGGRLVPDRRPGPAAPAVALCQHTGESVQLYVREGDRRRCAVSLPSPHGLRWIVERGVRSCRSTSARPGGCCRASSASSVGSRRSRSASPAWRR